MDDPIIPLHQHQIDAAVRKGLLPPGEVPRILERFRLAGDRGPLYDMAEAIAESAGLTRAQVEEIRREAKSAYLAPAAPPPATTAVPATPVPLPPAPRGPSRVAMAAFGALCVGLGSGLTLLVVRTGERDAPELAARPEEPGPARPEPPPTDPAVRSGSAQPPPVEPRPEPGSGREPTREPPPRHPRSDSDRPRPHPEPDPEEERDVRPPAEYLRHPRLLQGWLISLPDEDLARLVEDRRRYEDYLRLVVAEISRSSRDGFAHSPEANAFLKQIDRRVRALRER